MFAMISGCGGPPGRSRDALAGAGPAEGVLAGAAERRQEPRDDRDERERRDHGEPPPVAFLLLPLTSCFAHAQLGRRGDHQGHRS